MNPCAPTSALRIAPLYGVKPVIRLPPMSRTFGRAAAAVRNLQDRGERAEVAPLGDGDVDRRVGVEDPAGQEQDDAPLLRQRAEVEDEGVVIDVDDPESYRRLTCRE